MSRLLVDQIRSNSASSDALTLDGSGNLTIPGNLTCSGNASISGTPTGFGGGKVLKIGTASYTGGISYNSSTTYADTGLSGSFTTSASGHAGILVLAKGTLGAGSSTNATDAYALMNLIRTPSGGSDTELAHAFIGNYVGANAAPTIYGNVILHYYDTGTSANTTYTYRCQYKKQSNATNANWNGYNGPATLTFIEIGT